MKIKGDYKGPSILDFIYTGPPTRIFNGSRLTLGASWLELLNYAGTADRAEIFASQPSQPEATSAPKPLALTWHSDWHCKQANFQQLLALFAALALLREQHGPRAVLGRTPKPLLTDLALALMERWLEQQQQQQSQQLLAIKTAASMSEKDTGSDEEDTSDDDWEMVDGDLGVRGLPDDKEGASGWVTSRLSTVLWAGQNATPDSGSNSDEYGFVFVPGCG